VQFRLTPTRLSVLRFIADPDAHPSLPVRAQHYTVAVRALRAAGLVRESTETRTALVLTATGVQALADVTPLDMTGADDAGIGSDEATIENELSDAFPFGALVENTNTGRRGWVVGTEYSPRDGVKIVQIDYRDGSAPAASSAEFTRVIANPRDAVRAADMRANPTMGVDEIIAMQYAQYHGTPAPVARYPLPTLCYCGPAADPHLVGKGPDCGKTDEAEVSGAALTAEAIADMVRANLVAFGGRQGFLQDPGGWLDHVLADQPHTAELDEIAGQAIDLIVADHEDAAVPTTAEEMVAELRDEWSIVDAYVMDPGPGTVHIPTADGSVFLSDAEGSHPDGTKGHVIGRRYDDGRDEEILWEDSLARSISGALGQLAEEANKIPDDSCRDADDVDPVHVATLTHVATLNTPSYSFMTVGATADEARDVMRRAWEQHAAETGANYTFDDLADEVQVLAAQPGAAYRDGEQMHLF
jgi:hypothetical protein